MRVCLLVAALSLGLLSSCKPASFWSVDHTSPDTLRSLKDGQVLGGDGRFGSHAWLGLPYAKPPVGEARWKKPQPSEPWSGVRQATTFGPVCPQPGGTLGGGKAGEVVGSEDCLTLSVWAPRFTTATVPTASARLPVMVWIHGGGNSIGTSAFYDGGHLATEQNVIVVGVQYRLGPLGWLRHPALREGADPVDASGNYGTLDLIRSLEWVRDNAAAFGGDPGNVTIFGESAGGLNVYTLLLAPAAKGLFHRAIIESGGFWTTPLERAEAFKSELADAHPNSSNEVLARLLVTQHRASDAAEAKRMLQTMSATELARWMRSVPADAILKTYTGGRAGMLDAPLVFRDGVVLPGDDWVAQFAKPDGWNKVPVLVGSNRDEMRLFLFLDPDRVHRVLGIFPRLTDEKSYVATADAMSRFWKLNGVDRPVEALLKSGATEVYAYRWDWHDEPTVGGGDLSVMLGASHGLEVPFVFGHFEMGPLNVVFTEANAAGREAVSSAMRQYWAQFARTGNPARGTSGTLPTWSPVTIDTPTNLLFDVEKNGGVRLATAVEQQSAILADLLADARLDAKEKCRVLRELTNWGRGITRADYEAQTLCRDYAYETYPWK